jgi:hypothetical protein
MMAGYSRLLSVHDSVHAEHMIQHSFIFEDQEDVVIFRDPAFEQNKRHAIHRWVPWIAGFSADF